MESHLLCCSSSVLDSFCPCQTLNWEAFQECCWACCLPWGMVLAPPGSSYRACCSSQGHSRSLLPSCPGTCWGNRVACCGRSWRVHGAWRGLHPSCSCLGEDTSLNPSEGACFPCWSPSQGRRVEHPSALGAFSQEVFPHKEGHCPDQTWGSWSRSSRGHWDSWHSASLCSLVAGGNLEDHTGLLVDHNFPWSCFGDMAPSQHASGLLRTGVEIRQSQVVQVSHKAYWGCACTLCLGPSRTGS